MRTRFNIKYYTKWGQRLFLRVLSPSFVYSEVEKKLIKSKSQQGFIDLPLRYLYDGIWSDEYEFDKNTELEYCYVFENEHKELAVEPNSHHVKINVDKDIYDMWQNNLVDKVFFSSALSENKHREIYQPAATSNNERKKVIISCYAPTLKKNQILKICGSNDKLGNWEAGKALQMQYSGDSLWSISFEYDPMMFPVYIKFIAFNSLDNNIYFWESGENRLLEIVGCDDYKEIIFTGFHLNDSQHNRRESGVAIPVFSLKSEKSFGIGEFTDLNLLVDWACKTGMNFIQILPINDTTMEHTWKDSYPYNAISIFALHPAFINLYKTGILKDAGKMEFYEAERLKLNDLDKVDYDKVTELKWSYLRDIYNQEKETAFESDDYKLFFEENKDWLVPYAAFSYLRDVNKTPNFKWWEKYSSYDKKAITVLTGKRSKVYDEIRFFYFIQYHLHIQLKKAVEYANANGVMLKGDIPIGISRNSVEAWSNPELFNMDSQAGAPPDDFSVLGQNWGFPTYKWDEMEKDNYKWWKRRFNKMTDYFQAYRIDHILGFFRIWEIPMSAVQGLLGYFNPALPYSRKELEDSGFYFDRKYLHPNISEYDLDEIFGVEKEKAISEFLIKNEFGNYSLRKEYDTQREISNYLVGVSSNPEIKVLVDKLFRFAADVLFIEDAHKPGYYHPRISAQYTFAYRYLNDKQKNAFNRLYDEFFYKRHNKFWADEALKKLPELTSCTDMLTCAEDLGMIPDSVSGVLDYLKIISLEIQRMPKTSGVLFDNPETYPYLSVCTTSTHDMSPIREWWSENPQMSQIFFNSILKRPGCAPLDCTTDICRQIIMSHLNSPAILTILPFQDWTSIDESVRNPDFMSERINIPSNPRHYWRYRMHITLERLNEAKEFNKLVFEMNRGSGRSQ